MNIKRYKTKLENWALSRNLSKLETEYVRLIEKFSNKDIWEEDVDDIKNWYVYLTYKFANYHNNITLFKIFEDIDLECEIKPLSTKLKYGFTKYNKEVCGAMSDYVVDFDNIKILKITHHDISDSTVFDRVIFLVNPNALDKFENLLNKIKKYNKKACKSKEYYNKLILPKKLKKDIFNDINNFLNSKELYKDKLGLPWKRGYCFYGPPGGGKTLAIRAISQYFGLKSVNASNISKGDKITIGSDRPTKPRIVRLLELDNTEQPRLYYIEDIDRITPANKTDISKLTTYGLLNAIDGVEIADNTIIIFTTNHANTLDEALINRPGRIDRIFKFPYPKAKQINAMFDYYDIEIENQEIIVEKLNENNFSMAYIEEFVKSALLKHQKSNFTKDEANEIYRQLKQQKDSYRNGYSDDEERKMGF